jgi:hypothetical protein
MQVFCAKKLYIFEVMFSVFQDFIGRSCPTTDCVTQANERSAITKIEIVGGDATVKTSIEAPKIEATIKESKKTK